MNLHVRIAVCEGDRKERWGKLKKLGTKVLFFLNYKMEKIPKEKYIAFKTGKFAGIGKNQKSMSDM